MGDAAARYVLADEETVRERLARLREGGEVPPGWEPADCARILRELEDALASDDRFDELVWAWVDDGIRELLVEEYETDRAREERKRPEGPAIGL